MKKIFALLALMGCVAASLSAQSKVNSVVDDDYTRNSISVIVVNRGDNMDNYVLNAVNTINIGGKFDKNRISTDRIVIKTSRTHEVSVDNVSSILQNMGVAKQILSYWYQRRGDGVMSDALLLQRGMYSVKDQEVLNAQVSKVGISALGEKGYDLVKGSYVYVLDYYNFRSGDESYNVDMYAHIYQLDYSEEVLEKIYSSWIYEDDTPEVRAQKNQIYDSIEVSLSYVTSVKASGSSSSNNSEAINTAYDNAMRRSENEVDDWNVTTSIITTKPIKAKIGTKEGLKNGQRFQVHKIVENRDGELDSKAVGYVRATDIANNASVATGESAASSFYQISGGNVQEGMILKQKNDLKMGVTLAGCIGGYSPFEVGLELLSHINTKGTSTYAMIDLGIDSETVGDFTAAYASVYVGIGMGLRPIRQLEFTPFAQVGVDIMSTTYGSSSSEYEFADWASYLAKVGARLSWQIIYPIQIYAQADAGARFGDGAMYSYYNEQLLDYGMGHDVFALGLSFGVKVSF